MCGQGGRGFAEARKRLGKSLIEQYAAIMSCPEFVFHPLNRSGRKREFNEYNDDYIRASVVYLWLVGGWTARALDEIILHHDERYPNAKNIGMLSHGILGYFGLNRHHQGLFNGMTDVDILALLQRICVGDDMAFLYKYIAIYIAGKGVVEIDSEQESKKWIKEKLLRNVPEEKYNEMLLSLPNKENRIIINNQIRYFSSQVLKESVKDIYDFRCQICNQVILRTGFHFGMSREESWNYMSADVHHILPLSKNGPDARDNMICLCPTCHRKFHSGEFRLISSRSVGVILSDELLGKKAEIRNLHQIVLY